MTKREMEEERTRLRRNLGVRNRTELTEMFDNWDFDGSDQIKDAYKLDRLEFVLS